MGADGHVRSDPIRSLSRQAYLQAEVAESRKHRLLFGGQAL
jgi:hypothetical protein